MMKYSINIILIGWVLCGGYAGFAHGGESNVIEEVIVSAERRESTLMQTPVAISVFNEAFLDQSTVRSIQDVAPYSPGFSYTQVSNFPQLNMRGIGLEQINMGGEPGVAFHVDGVYLARPFVNDAVFVDLARVEVLRGPQGTLYGRNATGGSVNLIANAPTAEPEGHVGLLVGSDNRIRASAVASGPLGNSALRGRLSVVSDKRDGYLDNELNGRDVEDADTLSTRGALEIDWTSRLTMQVAFDYMTSDDTGPLFRVGDIGGTAPALGGRVANDPWKIFADGPSDQEVRSSGASVRLNWEFDQVDIMSLTAFRRSRFDLLSDLDGTDFLLVNEDLHEDANQISQEFQFASKGNAATQWMVGAYFFKEEADLDYAFDIPVLGTQILFLAEQDTTAYALFGEMSWSLTDRLSLTTGLRFSKDEKDGSTQQTFFVVGNVEVDDDWTAWTPRLVLDYSISESTFIYASIGRGFKAGGINTGSLQAAAYDPEYIWNYELGLKTRAFENRVQLNVAAFYYEYDDLQVTQFAVGQTFIENAAEASGNGLELEATALMGGGFTVNLGLAYLNAEFTDYLAVDSFRPALGVLDLDGNTLPRAPEFSGSLIVQHDLSFDSGGLLTTRLEYQYRDDFYFTPFNTSFAEGGGFNLLNTRIAYTSADMSWEIAAFGKNLTDEEYETATTVSGINGGTLELFGAPRTYGLEMRYRFQ